MAPRGRQLLTVRVAALLAAADCADRISSDARRSLARGDVVLADRYAWTGIAREAARGLDLAWVAAVYRFMPAPDLIVFHRQEPATALARALATRSTPAGAEAVGAAYAEFLGRLVAAYERLIADAGAGPWPVETIVLDPRASAGTREAAVRAAVRPLLDDPGRRAASA